jgi:26S proteasome regulatory subunit N1
LAIGIVFSGIQDPVDPACALLQEKLQDKSTVTRIGATLGLGLAYANSKRNTVVVGDSCVVAELRKVSSRTFISHFVLYF